MGIVEWSNWWSSVFNVRCFCFKMLANIDSEIRCCERQLFALGAAEFSGVGVTSIIDMIHGTVEAIKAVCPLNDMDEKAVRYLILKGRSVLRVPETLSSRKPDAVSDFLIRFIVQYAFPDSIGRLTPEQRCNIVWLIKRAIFLYRLKNCEEKSAYETDLDGFLRYRTKTLNKTFEIFELEESLPAPQPDIEISICNERDVITENGQSLTEKLIKMKKDAEVPRTINLRPDIEQFAIALRNNADGDKEYCATNRLVEFLIRVCVVDVFSKCLGCEETDKKPLLFLLAGILMSFVSGDRSYLDFLITRRFDCESFSICGMSTHPLPEFPDSRVKLPVVFCSVRYGFTKIPGLLLMSNEDDLILIIRYPDPDYECEYYIPDQHNAYTLYNSAVNRFMNLPWDEQQKLLVDGEIIRLWGESNQYSERKWLNLDYIQFDPLATDEYIKNNPLSPLDRDAWSLSERGKHIRIAVKTDIYMDDCVLRRC